MTWMKSRLPTTLVWATLPNFFCAKNVFKKRPIKKKIYIFFYTIQCEHVKRAFAWMFLSLMNSTDSFTEHFPNFSSLFFVGILFLNLQDLCK